MSRVKFTCYALLRVLAEYIMVFPLLYLISGFMSGSMPVIFLISVYCFAALGVLTRRLIPVPWLQLAIGLPLCMGAAVWLGVTFGSRAEPINYVFPAIIAPFAFYRGKQHAQNDWNVILPTFAPCVIMVLNFVIMALINYLGRFSGFAAVMTPAGILSLIVSFCAMNYINRRNLAENQRTESLAATAVSRSLSLQNHILLGILLGLGALLSCMPWLLTAAEYLFQFAGFLVGLLVNLILSLVPPLEGTPNSSSRGHLPEDSSVPNPFWDSFFDVLADVFFVIVIIMFAVLLFFVIRKVVRLLNTVLRNMLEQKGFISGGDEGFEDSQESIVKLRDLPRKYYNDLKKRVADLRRGKRWSDLTTESERVRYLYRSSLKRAEKSGYRHKSSYTPHEALDEASQDLPQIQPVQNDLAASYDLVRYAEREPQPGDAERIRDQSGL